MPPAPNFRFTLPLPLVVPVNLMVAVVMFCHFIASFAALGMPAFFALILQKSLHQHSSWLAGWLYVVPTLFAAVSSPWWGKLADRFGKRRLLLRAQLGLAGSFLLAGYADSVVWFFLALCLQGILGGTFAASNAYLASLRQGTALSQSLNAMQWSARAALLLAPLAVGYGMAHLESPVQLYRYLACLPLLAAGLTLLLTAQAPENPPASAPASAVSPSPSTSTNHHSSVLIAETSARHIFWLNFAFAFAIVLTFPYFVPHVLAQLASSSNISSNIISNTTSALSPTVLAGLLFGLPHGVYLLLALPLGRVLGQRKLLLTLALAYAALAVSLLPHIWPGSLWLLTLARLLLGLALTISYLALHGLMASVVQQASAGHGFGWFDASGKWGGVAAGLGAGVLVSYFGLAAPFVLAALLLLGGALHALVLHHRFQSASLLPAPFSTFQQAEHHE